jgi:hypothetical protein
VVRGWAVMENDGSAGTHGRSEGEGSGVVLTLAGRLSSAPLEEFLLVLGSFEFGSAEFEVA